MLIILVLFVGTTFVALRSHSHAKPGPKHTTTSSTTTTTSTTQTTVPRSTVSVQVANGTTVPGLAGTYTRKLQTYSWDALPAINGPTETATVVYYHPGFLWAAQAIATEIGAPATAAKPIGATAPVPGASGDKVIVILGPDVAS